MNQFKMEIAKNAIKLACCGVKDCVCGVFLFFHFLYVQELQLTDRRCQQSLTFSNAVHKLFRERSDDSVFSNLFQCAVFSVLFYLPVYIFKNYVIGYLFDLFLTYMNEDVNSFDRLNMFLNFLFLVLWILPLLVLSKFLNFFWYKAIADLTQIKVGVRSRSPFSTSEFLADQIKSILVQFFHYIQSYILYIFPLPVIIQHLWYLFHLSLLFSLYAFEYKWLTLGWPLHRRLLTIDRKWPYFLGFGLPLALLTLFVDSFITSMIIFATLFPIYVISSTVTYDSQSPIFSPTIHSFKVVDLLSDAVVSFFIKLR